MGHPCPDVTLDVEVEGKLPWHTTVVLADRFPPLKTPAVIRVNVHSPKTTRAATTGAAGTAITVAHDIFLTEVAISTRQHESIIAKMLHSVVLV